MPEKILKKNKGKKVLGRGAEVFFDSNRIDEKKENIDKEKNNDAVNGEIMVNIALVEPNINQPRKIFSKDELEELSESIKQYGILQPLIVNKKDNRYEIIAGERRWRAAQLAGLKKIPVIVREYDSQKIMEISIIENIQREDLNPIEEALAYKALIEEYSLKQEEIALKVSKKRSTITNSLRLLKLSENIQKMILEELITAGHARALLSVEDKDIQEKIANDIIKNNLSVRETEKLVKDILNNSNKKVKKESKEYLLYYKEYEDSIRSILGTKVHINSKDKNKGRIEIDYYSASELERIIHLIRSIT